MTNISKTVDSLGKVRAKIADLEVQEEHLKKQLVETGKDEIEGKQFRALVVRSERTTVDYKEVISKLPQTPQLKRLLKKNSETKEQVSVKVTAR